MNRVHVREVKNVRLGSHERKKNEKKQKSFLIPSCKMRRDDYIKKW